MGSFRSIPAIDKRTLMITFELARTITGEQAKYGYNSEVSDQVYGV
jgi:hypothetical protein